MHLKCKTCSFEYQRGKVAEHNCLKILLEQVNKLTKENEQYKNINKTLSQNLELTSTERDELRSQLSNLEMQNAMKQITCRHFFDGGRDSKGRWWGTCRNCGLEREPCPDSDSD